MFLFIYLLTSISWEVILKCLASFLKSGLRECGRLNSNSFRIVRGWIIGWEDDDVSEIKKHLVGGGIKGCLEDGG